MTSPADKAELKALLHLIVDQGEPSLVADGLAKISNPQYLAVAQMVSAALLPIAIKAEDSIIDSKLA